MSNTKLPALPERTHFGDASRICAFTADQMHAYAEAAILADRERQAGEAVATSQMSLIIEALQNSKPTHDHYPEPRGRHEAALKAARALAAAPSPDGKAEQAEAPSEIEAKELWDCLCRLTNLRIGHHVMSAADRPDADQWLCIQFNSFVEAEGMRKALKNWHEAARAKFKPDATQPTASNAGEREAMQQALEALEGHASRYCENSMPEDTVVAIDALRAALASKPPQPVRPESVLKTLMTLNAYRAGLYGLCQGPEPKTLEEALEHLRARLRGKPPAGEQKPVADVTDFKKSGEPIIAWRDGATVRRGGALYAAPQPEQMAQDSVRLDWLCEQFVTVRTPMRYGSAPCFLGSPDDNDGESVPWDIRAAIDAARARGEKGGA